MGYLFMAVIISELQHLAAGHEDRRPFQVDPVRLSETRIRQVTAWLQDIKNRVDLKSYNGVGRARDHLAIHQLARVLDGTAIPQHEHADRVCALFNTILYKLNSDQDHIPSPVEIPQVFVARERNLHAQKSSAGTEEDVYVPQISLSTQDPGNLSELILDWSQMAAVGHVMTKTEHSDVDRAKWRLLRAMRNLARHHPASTTIYGFTILTTSFTLWTSDAQSYQSSASYDLANANDYHEIVKIIALLGKQRDCKMDSWKPQKDMVLSIRNANGLGNVSFKVVDVKDIESRLMLWGSRTAIWQVTGRYVDCGTGESAETTSNEVQLIIKSGWYAPDLIGRELKIVRHINQQTERLQKDQNDFPTAIGRLVSSTGPATNETVDLSKRQTPAVFVSVDNDDQRQGDVPTHLELSLSVFKYPLTGHLIAQDRPTPVLALLGIYKSIVASLHTLALIGVHYRDFNTGNILQASDDPERGILIDFGGVRIEMNSRGEELNDNQNEMDNKVAVSLDDCRSANEMFISIRVQAIGKLQASLEKKQKLVRRCQRIVRDDEAVIAHETARDPEWLSSSSYMALKKTFRVHQNNLRDETRKLLESENQLANSSHRFVDDLESLIYVILYQTHMSDLAAPGHALSSSTSEVLVVLRSFIELDNKEEVWSSKTAFRDLVESIRPNGWWTELVVLVHDHVLATQDALNQASTTQASEVAIEAADTSNVVSQTSTGLCEEEDACFKVVYELFAAVIGEMEKKKICDTETVVALQQEVYRKVPNAKPADFDD